MWGQALASKGGYYMEKREDENLISIDEVINQAQKLGVVFGNGDPRNRLRYYTKIGLLSHAQRKSFNNNHPEGAYPGDVVALLIEIDRKIKAGKSIQTIKREIKEEKEKEEKKKERLKERLFEAPFAPSLPIQTFQRKTWEGLPIQIYKPSFPSPLLSPEIKEEFQPEKKLKPPFRLSAFLKPIFIASIFVLIVFFINAKINFVDSISYFLASIGSEVKTLTQLPPSPSQEEIFSPSPVEPYLTINAETAINGPLNVKESVSSPAFIMTKGDFKGLLTLTTLTADRAYTFPNQSGIVCLSTGNCVGLGGEVISSGGTQNRLAKFITSQKIGNSSINDLYSGTSITIGSTGNVGIGVNNPAYNLQIAGKIQASGDICTDLSGGKCLSQLTAAVAFYGGGGGGGGGGVGGSGSTNYLSIWTGATTLGNSILFQADGNIGIGTTTPSQKLDVAGTIKMIGFQLPTNATSGYVLTSNNAGFGTWQPLSEGVLSSGTAGQTLRHNGTTWLADSFLYNTGSAIGIGTTSTLATLTIAGGGRFQGPLTISTTTLAQLVLEYDDANYLRFLINSTSSEILSSKTMLINSLTGEIRLGGDVNLFNATSATIWGGTFISPANDSTVRKVGELVLRNSTPIFRFAVSAQTASITFVRISKYFPDPLDFLPPSLPGTTRQFAFLINFADDIATSSQTDWRVYRPVNGTTSVSFSFSGQNLPSLEEGTPHLSGFYSLPGNDWQLEVKVPSGNPVRIFNIFLLAYDQIN